MSVETLAVIETNGVNYPSILLLMCKLLCVLYICAHIHIPAILLIMLQQFHNST